MENIISRIDRIATENPDQIAYDYLGRTNTYGELKEKSDALAAYLKVSNLPEKAPLIVFGGQDFQMIATFLGIVKSGRAYIPVDVHSSEDRVKVIEEIARPAACIALSELPETGREVPVISRERLTRSWLKKASQLAKKITSGETMTFTSFSLRGRPASQRASGLRMTIWQVSLTGWTGISGWKRGRRPYRRHRTRLTCQ